MEARCLEVFIHKHTLKNDKNLSQYINFTTDLDKEIEFCKILLSGLTDNLEESVAITQTGRSVYAYLTPIIIGFGLIGNLISLSVFMMKPMRKLSASIYLGVLAISDCMVLLSYALFEWLSKGLPQWPGGYTVNAIGINGICQTYLFISYTFRFFSAYLITIFTVERYVGVCKPLHRRSICTNSFARNSICSLFALSCIVSLYKPILSTVHNIDNGSAICGGRKSYQYVNFVLDAIYASLITGVSVVIITFLNILILCKFWRTRRRHKQSGFLGDDNNLIKIQFTVIILMVSSTFVLLNLPYSVMWCLTYITDLNKGLDITKAVFLCNYACNFLLYSLTGAYFRKQLRKRFRCLGFIRKKYKNLRIRKDLELNEPIYHEQSVVLTGCTVVHSTSL